MGRVLEELADRWRQMNRSHTVRKSWQDQEGGRRPSDPAREDYGDLGLILG